MPDEEEKDELILLGSIAISVYMDMTTGEEMMDVIVENLDTYTAVGVLAQAQMEQLLFSESTKDD